MDQISWTVLPEESGMRLDRFVSQKVEQLSRSGVARLITEKNILVANRQAKPGLVVKEGDRIVYQPPPVEPLKTPAQNLAIQVLFQDQDIAVVNKPVGMVTHPAAGHHDGTLVNALLFHLDQLSGIGGCLRPGIIHRLDKDTSGLLLVAKHDQSHHLLATALQARLITRVYQAVTWQPWESSSVKIENHIGRDPNHRKRFAVVARGGKWAQTRINQLAQTDWCSLIECYLTTGRTHQIRVHCQACRHPVIGDRVYGKRGELRQLQQLGIERPAHQLLHAWRLSFDHPRTKKRMVFEIQPPDDFQRFLRQAKLVQG